MATAQQVGTFRSELETEHRQRMPRHPRVLGFLGEDIRPAATCVLYHQTVRITSSECVYYITRACVLHHQNVCITSPERVYYIIRMCVLHHQNVCII